MNPKATWVDDITVAELKTMWAPEAQGKVTRWSQVRPGWPDRELHLFGAGVDSGTYDYFTEAIVGKARRSRGDFTSSEDDNVLVQGVASDELALGFFPFAYYEENKERLKLVPVDDGKADNGAGPSRPAPRPSKGGTYQPLSRPVFIYVSTAAARAARGADSSSSSTWRKAAPLADEVGYVAARRRAATSWSPSASRSAPTGSVFARRRIAGRAHHRAAAGQARRAQ